MMLIFSIPVKNSWLFFLALSIIVISCLIVSCGTIPVPGAVSISKSESNLTLAKEITVDSASPQKREKRSKIESTINNSTIKNSTTMAVTIESEQQAGVLIEAEEIIESTVILKNPGPIVSSKNILSNTSVDKKSIDQLEVIRKSVLPDVKIVAVTTAETTAETTPELNVGDKKFAQAKIKYKARQYAAAMPILEELNTEFDRNLKYRDLLILTYIKYAGYLENKADLLEAQSILEKALVIQPHNKNLQKQLKDLEKRRNADMHYTAGLDAVKAQQQDKAIEEFNQTLNLKPDHESAKKQIVLLKIKYADSYHKNAMILYRKQKLDEAIETWGRVLMLDPEHDMAKLYRARAIELKEKLEKL